MKTLVITVDEQVLSDARRRLLVELGNGSPEYTHERADEVLCDVLTALGLTDLVELWRRVDKWYA